MGVSGLVFGVSDFGIRVLKLGFEIRGSGTGVGVSSLSCLMFLVGVSYLIRAMGCLFLELHQRHLH